MTVSTSTSSTTTTLNGTYLSATYPIVSAGTITSGTINTGRLTLSPWQVNPVLVKSPAPPAPAEGAIWLDTATNDLKVYAQGMWRLVGNINDTVAPDLSPEEQTYLRESLGLDPDTHL